MTIPVDECAELSPQQKAELEEASQAANANPREGSDWPTVRARLLEPQKTVEPNPHK